CSSARRTSRTSSVCTRPPTSPLAFLLSPAPDSTSPLVLGIDPGLNVCGWGIVAGGASPRYVAGGVIRPRRSDTIGRRLLHIHDALAAIVAEHSPGEVAIEEPFVGSIQPAAELAIRQARAGAVL